MNPLKLAALLATSAVLAAGPASAQAPAAAQTAAPAAADTPDAVPLPMEPEARAAVDRMAAYLRTLNSFEIQTETSLDLVTEAGQRVQLDGSATYRVRRPNGFVISVNTEWKKRTFYYDGSQFTVYAPELGYYATAAAPPTILETLDTLYDKYRIALPIEDLFLWNDPSARRKDALESAMEVGPATIDGAKATQYVFRQGEFDWQVWIKDGDQPLPLKLVIVDRSDLAQPAYVAKLTWKLNPFLAADDFKFKPPKDAKAIRLTASQERSAP